MVEKFFILIIVYEFFFLEKWILIKQKSEWKFIFVQWLKEKKNSKIVYKDTENYSDIS